MRMLRGPKVTQLMKVLACAIAVATASIVMACDAKADESAFLKTLAGNWSGKGTVKVRTNAPTMTVTCRFKSDANASSLALNGRCTSLVVFPASSALTSRPAVTPTPAPTWVRALALRVLAESALVMP